MELECIFVQSALTKGKTMHILPSEWRQPECEAGKQSITHASLDLHENIHRTSVIEKRICSCGSLDLKGLI